MSARKVFWEESDGSFKKAIKIKLVSVHPIESEWIASPVTLSYCYLCYQGICLIFSPVFEELEEADEMYIENDPFDDKEQDSVATDDDKLGGEVKDDKLIDDVNEEVADMNHFLGINFGLDKKATVVDLASATKNQSWFDIKSKEFLCILKEIGRMLISEISGEYISIFKGHVGM